MSDTDRSSTLGGQLLGEVGEALRLVGAVLAIGVSALVVGCGASAAERAAVTIATETPQECKRVGAVSASANSGATPEENAEAARDALRGQAADLGANRVVIEKQEDKGIVVRLAGSAYRCP